MQKIIHKILSVFLVATMAFFSTPSTFALDEDLWDKFDSIGIYYYNPQSNSSCIVALGSYSGSSSKGLSATQAAFVDTYHDIAQELSVEYGIPWETVMAQGILESGAGTSNFAINRNNFFGIGAFDSNPNNAFSYSSPSEGWRGYYENIRKTATYRQHGAFKSPNITDPYSYARAIKDAGYATSPNYVPVLDKLISAIENRAKEKGWQSSAELAVSFPKMLTNAANNAAGDSTISYQPGSYTDVMCAEGGNGDINSTALALSWPDRSHSPDDPKASYTAALNSVGLSHYGESCVNVGKSCDAFVATVLRYSQADPNVVCCGAANMLSYFQNHPDLYEEIPNLGNTSNMQPGDIRARSGHVEIFIQREDGSFGIASASHCDRTADHAGNYYPSSEYKIFRRR